jgi:hypothetical protein
VIDPVKGRDKGVEMTIMQFVQDVWPTLVLLHLTATLVITVVTLSETDDA